MNLTTTIQPMTGGADAVAGLGSDYLFAINGTFATGDKLTVTLTDQTGGIQQQIGAGYATGVNLQFFLTLKNKLYGVADNRLFFSAIGDATLWNDPNGAGNGFVEMSNNYGITENLNSLAIYQGKLAVIGRSQVQVWAVDADPAQNAQQQVLSNVGTQAKLTVQPVGDLDVYLLSDSGIRSIRVRDASNNAIVQDVGTPIDLIIQPLLATMTAANIALSCGIVEPLTNRYWCYIPGSYIYVFSNFSTSNIQAWSTYLPTYWNGSANTSFTPEKFVCYAGHVYVRAGDNIFLYGGTDNNTYDQCQLQARLPYLDCDTPATMKDFRGVDVAMEGTWTIKVGTDYTTDDFTKTVYQNNTPSFHLGKIPLNRKATHFSLDFTETSAAYARLSNCLVHFNQLAAK